MNPSSIGVQSSKGFSEIKASLEMFLGLFVGVEFSRFWKLGPAVDAFGLDIFSAGVVVVVVVVVVGNAFGVVVFDAEVVVVLGCCRLL